MTVRPRDSARLLVLALAGALLVLAAVLFAQSQSVSSDPALDNRALLDETIGRDVVAVISRGLADVLSYDHADPEATRAAADRVLSGRAREEYDTLFASLQERAPGQKLVLTAQVQAAALQTLSATEATLLVFLDQSSTRAKDQQSSVSAAQLSVTAERTAAGWVVTGLTPL